MSLASRFDSRIINLKMPWEKEMPVDRKAPIGSIECYSRVKGSEDFQFVSLWTKLFYRQVFVIYWDQATCNLLVG